MSHEKVGCVSFCKTRNDFHSLTSYASSYSCDLFSLTKVTQETLSHLFSLWRIFVSLSTVALSHKFYFDWQICQPIFLRFWHSLEIWSRLKLHTLFCPSTLESPIWRWWNTGDVDIVRGRGSLSVPFEWLVAQLDFPTTRTLCRQSSDFVQMWEIILATLTLHLDTTNCGDTQESIG